MNLTPNSPLLKERGLHEVNGVRFHGQGRSRHVITNFQRANVKTSEGGTVMKRKVLWLFIGCFMLYPKVGVAQVQTIRKEVRQIFGGSQSPDNARIGAITRAKREALEEAGTYLESLTIVRDHQVAKDEILALSSGVLRATVIEEENFVEGSAFGIRIVAEVQVDLSTLEDRVRKLLADREDLERLRDAERRERELLEKLKDLEAENARVATGGTDKQREDLRERFAQSSAKLAANEWLSRAEGLHPKVALDFLTEAIRIDPKFVAAYINRGVVYYDQGQYQRAIQDYDQVIRLDPGVSVAYSNRGAAYNALGRQQRAIEDYNQAIRLDPDNAVAYNNRGIMYNAMGKR